MKASLLSLFLLLLPLTAGLSSATTPDTLPFASGLPGALEKSAVRGDLAFCATSAGLLVLDVSDPAQIVQVAMLPLAGSGRSIAVSGGYAYLLAWDIGLVVIDIGDPAMPFVAGTCAEPTRPGDRSSWR